MMDPDLRAYLLEQRRHYQAMADKIASMLGLRPRAVCPVCGAHLE